MSKSVYVVNNMEQEGNVLKALIESGYKHPHTEKYKYSFVPSINGSAFDGFPYEIIADKEEYNIYWQTIPKQMENVSQLNKPDELIIYDGRKESKMKISKEVYDALMEWRDGNKNNLVQILCIRGNNLSNIPDVVSNWWLHDTLSNFESNQRLIAIIRWVNGEDVFEIEKPKKWIVRSKDTDIDGDYLYAILRHDDNLTDVMNRYDKSLATRFDTKEEAQEWCNSHQEVIEVN